MRVKQLELQSYKTAYMYECQVCLLFVCQAATTLSKTTLAKYTAAKNTLPEDLHYDADKLFRLFIKPKIMVSNLTCLELLVILSNLKPDISLSKYLFRAIILLFTDKNKFIFLDIKGLNKISQFKVITNILSGT